MAVYMGAGPSVMYATHALDAFSNLKTKRRSRQLKPSNLVG